MEKFSNKNDTKVLNELVDMFGSVLHVDIIKSVALNCNWQLDRASNILAELSSGLSNDRVIPKQITKKKSSNINTVAYAAAGEDDSNIDVLIESEEQPNLNYRRVLTQPSRTRNRTPSKVIPPAKQNKSKRELEFERVRDHILTGVKVLVLLRGLPGSGKSHLARTLLATTIQEDHQRFVYSTDDYFFKDGVYLYNVIQLQDAHRWNQQRVYEAMHLGMSPIVVDNTNTQMWEMRPYAAMAVQFGYAVEILEPVTVWIFNPPELARRNIHGVPKIKIAEMLDRYEKFITPEKLFSMYDLRYKPMLAPPQPRLYPPTSRNIHPLLNIPAGIQRNPPQDQPKPKKERKRPRRKKQDQSDSLQQSDSASNGTISKSDSMYNLLTSDEDDEDSQSDLLSSDINKTNNEYVLVMPDKSLLYQTKQTEDLISFNDNDVITDKINYSADLEQTSKSATTHLIDSCVKLFNSVTTTPAQNAETPGEYPTFDLSSWGLTDDALISWEVVDKLSNKTVKEDGPQPQRNTSRQLSADVQENSTNTSSEDFNLLKNDSVTGLKILTTCSRNITDNISVVQPRSPSRVASFDKSTMTGSEQSLSAALTRSRCNNDTQHFQELVNLFPNIRLEDLKEIFDKCQGDINWAVDLLLDSNNSEITTTAQSAVDALALESIHEHTSECNCASKYDTPLYRNEEVEKSPMIENKKTPPRSKANKVTEETLQLKRQLEEQIKIDDNHYSDYLLNLRKKRHGEPSTSAAEVEETVAEETVAIETEDNQEEEEEEETSSEEELVEINVGTNFIEQLEKNCGDSIVDYPQGFQPVMQLPASLLRQLHAYWMQSVYQQMEAQSQIFDAMVREDAEFARRLQEKETAAANAGQNPVVPNLQEIMDMEIALAIYKADQEQWKKETPDDLASRMKRQKLFETFPSYDKNTLVEILQACGNSFDQTVQVLLEGQEEARGGGTSTYFDKQNELIENAKKEYMHAKQTEQDTNKVEETEVEDDICWASPEERANKYRELASHHLQMRTLCFTKANSAIQKGQTQVALYYSEIAQMHKQKYEHANILAATAFLTAHSSKQQNAQTLDLHYLYVKEAEQALAMFLDKQIMRLKTLKKHKATLHVITGRGNHSRGGISHIKPVVKRKLRERRLEFVELNPGLLKMETEERVTRFGFCRAAKKGLELG